MKILSGVFAMDADAQRTWRVGMGFWSLASQIGLRDFPEVELLFGAEGGLGRNDSASRRRGDGIDFPCPRLEVKLWLLGLIILRLKRQAAKKQQDRKQEPISRGLHGAEF